jgi:small subunit ribosomal protein S21
MYRIDPEAEYKGCCVVLREGESEDSLLKRFKKKYMKSGISQDLKKYSFYEKPSIKKKKKRIEANKKLLRLQSKKDKTMKRNSEKKLKKEE